MRKDVVKRSFVVKNPNDIIRAMDMTEKIARNIHLPKNDLIFLRLVTEEACMNAFEYCLGTGQSDFEIGWELNEQVLVIHLKHKGEKFSLDHIDNNEINYGLRGRGLKLIVNLMDEVDVEQNGENVEFFLRKYLNISHRERLILDDVYNP